MSAEIRSGFVSLKCSGLYMAEEFKRFQLREGGASEHSPLVELTFQLMLDLEGNFCLHERDRTP